MKAPAGMHKEIHSSINCNDDKDEINYRIFVHCNTEKLFKNLHISMY